MDYLTNYYKNLCEQLQEKLNILETQLGYVKANTEEEKRKLEAAAMRPNEGEDKEFEPSEVGIIVPHHETNKPVKLISKSEPKVHTRQSGKECPTCKKMHQSKGSN